MRQTRDRRAKCLAGLTATSRDLNCRTPVLGHRSAQWRRRAVGPRNRPILPVAPAVVPRPGAERVHAAASSRCVANPGDDYGVSFPAVVEPPTKALYRAVGTASAFRPCSCPKSRVIAVDRTKPHLTPCLDARPVPARCYRSGRWRWRKNRRPPSRWSVGRIVPRFDDRVVYNARFPAEEVGACLVNRHADRSITARARGTRGAAAMFLPAVIDALDGKHRAPKA